MKTVELSHFDYARVGRVPTQRGWCNLRVYKHAGQTIAVASEVITPEGHYANDGMTVINAIECVAECVVAAGHLFDVFIEHLPYRDFVMSPYGQPYNGYPEDFSQVRLQSETWGGQTRYFEAGFAFVTRAKVEALIGCSFEPVPFFPF